jgi:hypothetical protein
VACQTALATAPAEPVMPISPTPLMPSAFDVGIVLLDHQRLQRWHVGIHRDVVLRQVGVEDTAVCIHCVDVDQHVHLNKPGADVTAHWQHEGRD